jgi:hypothetical protein
MKGNTFECDEDSRIRYSNSLPYPLYQQLVFSGWSDRCIWRSERSTNWKTQDEQRLTCKNSSIVQLKRRLAERTLRQWMGNKSKVRSCRYQLSKPEWAYNRQTWEFDTNWYSSVPKHTGKMRKSRCDDVMLKSMVSLHWVGGRPRFVW